MRFIHHDIEGKRHCIWLEESEVGFWVHLDGQTHLLKRQFQRGGGTKSVDAVLENIRAPMPGRVTKIMANEGGKVLAHQTVLVMEAMKMEYNLKSNVEAVVKKLCCREGETVTQDQLLVEFETP